MNNLSPRQKYPLEYKVWSNTKRNCYPGYTTTTSYEQRGIKICKEWLEGGFKSFIDDMGPKPSPSHRLLRKDPLGHYNKDNCEWSLNTPRRVDEILITLDGETKNLTQWCKDNDLNCGGMHTKIKKNKKGLSAAEVLRMELEKRQLNL